jgi:hypothetical protein
MLLIVLLLMCSLVCCLRKGTFFKYFLSLIILRDRGNRGAIVV